MSTIVLGYDGSPSANAALAKTIELAPALGASVVVVFGFYISPLAGGDVHDFKERLEGIGEHEVGRAVADLDAAGSRRRPASSRRGLPTRSSRWRRRSGPT